MKAKDYALIGAGGGGGGGGSYRNRPDSLRSTDTFEAILGISSTRATLAPGGLKNLFIDGVPVEDGQGNASFKDFTTVLFDGDPTVLEPIQLKLGQSAGPTAVNLTLNNAYIDGSPGDWKNGTVPQSGVNFIDLRFIVQQLYRQTKEGVGDQTATIEVQLRPSGALNWINPLLDTTAPPYDQNGVLGDFGRRVFAPREYWDPVNTSKWSEPNPGYVRVTGKTSSSYVKELRIAVPNSGSYANKTWEIRCRLIERDYVVSGVNGENEDRRTIVWESATGVSSTAFGVSEEWRGIAHVSVYGKASDQINGIPEVTGIYDFGRYRVPPSAVWDPITRVFTTMAWDGTTTISAWTQCPAWQLKGLIEDDLSGISALAPGSTLNKWDTLEASKWFSEQVPDGKGGTHPRYSMNWFIEQPMQVHELVNYFAGAVGGFSWDEGDGQFRLRVERPENPVMVFTKENIVGEFVYSHTDFDVRYNDFTGVFRNEADRYNEDRVRVWDQASIDTTGRRHTTIALVGCSNRQEALRRLKIRLLSSLNETRMVTFTTNRQGGLLEPLSVIAVADGDLNSSTAIRSTGRVTAIDAARTRITVRDTLRLEVGVAYTVTLTIPNPSYNPSATTQPANLEWRKPTTTITRTVTNLAAQRGDVVDIYLDTALPVETPLLAPVALSAVGLPALPKQYRVTNVKPGDDGETFTVTAVEIYTSKWAESDNVSESAIFAQLVSRVVPSPVAPTGGMFSIRDYKTNFVTKRHLTVSWNRPATMFLDDYRVEHQYNGGPWTPLGTTRETYLELPEPQQGAHKFRVYTRDRRGAISLPLEGSVTVAENFNSAPTGQLSQPAVVVPVPLSGVIGSFTGLGGKFEIRTPLGLVTTGVTYSVVALTGGLSLSIDAGGNYTPSALTSDRGTAVLRAVYGIHTFEQTYNLVKNYADDFAARISGLEAAIDGKVTTFYGTVVPTSEGLGDLWFKSDTQKWYRAGIVGANEILAGEWVLTEDAGIGTAITAAAGAQATADGKVTTFYQDADPAVEARSGDLWVRPSDNPKVTNRRNAADTGWDIVANLVTEGAQIGVENGATNNRDSIYDPFNYATTADFEKAWFGVPGEGGAIGERSIVTSSDTPGGTCIQVGDNLGNDGATLVFNRSVPFDPEDLYEVGFDIEFLAASPTAYAYLGVRAEDAAGANLVSDVGTYCYVAVNSQIQNGAGRLTFRGYIRGRSAVGAGNNIGAPANDRSIPRPLPLNTVAMRPLILANNNGQPGIAKLHQAWLRKIGDATLIATGAWSSTRIYFRDEGVTYLGRSFGSKVDGNLNQVPPSTATSDANWYLVADKGADGTSNYQFRLNNDDMTFPADKDGNVTSYANGYFTCQVFHGSIDVTSSFGFTTPANPQSLSIVGTAPSFQINGGLDATEDSATVTIRATGSGPHASAPLLDQTITVSKSKAGQDGTPAPLVTLTSTTNSAPYDKDNAYLGGVIDFSTARVNIPTGTNYIFAIYRVSDGLLLVGPDTAAGFAAFQPANYSSAAAGTLTISAAGVTSLIAANGAFRVVASAPGYTVTDSQSVTKIKDGADGAQGATGAPGAAGTNGLNAYVHHAYADSIDGTVNFNVGVPGGRVFQGVYSDNTPADSTNPASYTWGPYTGPALFGLANFNANSIVGPDFIQKVAGGGLWNASGYSTESFIGGCVASYKIGSPGALVMFGLNTDPTLDADFASIDYAIYTYDVGNALLAYESGATTDLGATWAIGDILQVHYGGSSVRYLKNGIVLRTVQVAAGLRFFLDTSLITVGSRVEKITWAAAGAAGADGAQGATGPQGATGATGPAGVPGNNNAPLLIYKRAPASPAPALPTLATTYTFSTKTLTGLDNGWTTTVPADNGQPCWVSGAAASSPTDTDTIGAAEWAAPVIGFQSGTNGSAGVNNATVTLYKRSATLPAGPTTATTYDFNTGAATGQDNGWAKAFPANDGNPAWAITATALSTATTDTIPATEWPAAVEVVKDGAPGVSPVTVRTNPSSMVLKLDAAGAVKIGQLPLIFGISATKGGAGIAITSITITSSSGGTWVVSGSTVQLSAMAGGSAGGECTFTVVAGGETLTGNTVSFSTAADGATTNQISKTWTPTNTELAGASFAQSGANMAFNARPAGTLGVNLTGSVKPSGAVTADQYAYISKLQYSLDNGATWTDVTGSQANSTVSQDSSGGEPGVPQKWTAANINGTGPYSLTGLGASAAVLFRAMTMIQAPYTGFPAALTGSFTIFGDAN